MSFLKINMERWIGKLNAITESVSKFTVARNYHSEHGFTWLKRYASRHFSSVTNQWSPIKISGRHQAMLSRQFLIGVNYSDRPPKHLTRQSFIRLDISGLTKGVPHATLSLLEHAREYFSLVGRRLLTSWGFSEVAFNLHSMQICDATVRRSSTFIF